MPADSVSIRIYSGIARFPCDSMAFLLERAYCGQLIRRETTKIGATICQILKLKCTKFDFGWGACIGVMAMLSKFQTVVQFSEKAG